MWRRHLIFLGVLVLVGLYALPNWIVSLRPAPESQGLLIPGTPLSPGLDLKGGAQLLLQIDADHVERRQLGLYREQARQFLLDERVAARRVDIESRSALQLRYADLPTPEGNQEQLVLIELAEATPSRRVATELARQTQADIAHENRLIVMGIPQALLIESLQATTSSAIETIRRRIDETGVREPLIQRQASQRILIQMPGVADASEIKALLGKTAQLSLHLVEANRADTPTITLDSAEKSSNGLPAYSVTIEAEPIVTGEHLIDSQPSFQDNNPVVSFRFNPEGARLFGRTTRSHVGQQLAIVLDGEVISAPRIQAPILDGNGIIEGNFTAQSAADLALLLRSGALPAPIDILEERSVGPGLGQDSIDAGSQAIALAFVIVIIVMVFAYRLQGVAAVLALILNAALIVAALSALQATLTLPGLAGIVLTVGMAVDANILVFERAREEQRKFSSEHKNQKNTQNQASTTQRAKTMDTAYSKVLVTILDANITTLIAAISLFVLGSGPIRGFAVTLSIGVLSSMFSALVLTRYFVDAFSLRGARKTNIAPQSSP